MAKRGSRKSDSAGVGAISGGTLIAVLHGDDAMMQRLKLDELRTALTETRGEIDEHRFDGRSAALADVFDELRGYSLMATYKLVVVDEADDFVSSHREPLERYWDNPVDHATLVLRCSSWLATTKLHKNMPASGVVAACDAPSPAEAVSWLVGRAKDEYKAKLGRDAAQRLVDRLGPALGPLDSELAKLSLMVEPGESITPELIDDVVGRSSEEKAWVVQEALLQGLVQGRMGQVIAKVHELVEVAGQPDVLVMYFVADLTRKLCLARAMKVQGQADGQIGRALKIWPMDRQTLFFQALSALPPGSAGKLFHRMVELDARSKSGRGEPMRNLECFAAALADETGKAR